MDHDWESDLAGLLGDLSQVQDELLEFLAEKRGLLAAADTERLSAMQVREQELTNRLRACHDRRGELIEQAQAEGLRADSLRSLAATMPRQQRQPLEAQVRQSAARSRLLQHHSLTNWVVTQQTLLHLSQMLEIIGTGGRIRPTYGNDEAATAGGVLVDQTG